MKKRENSKNNSLSKVNKKQLMLKKFTENEKKMLALLEPKKQQIYIKLPVSTRKKVTKNVLMQLEKKGYDVSEYKYDTPKKKEVVRHKVISDYTVKKTQLPSISDKKAPSEEIANYWEFEDVPKVERINVESKVSKELPKELPKKFPKEGSNGKRNEEPKKQEHQVKKEINRGMDKRSPEIKPIQKKEAKLVKKEKKEIPAKKKTPMDNKGDVTIVLGKKLGQSLGTYVRKEEAKISGVKNKKEESYKLNEMDTPKPSLIQTVKNVIVIKMVVALIAAIISVLPIIMVLMTIIAIIMAIISFFVGIFAEEEVSLREERVNLLGTSQVSQEVLDYREDILEQLTDRGYEDYIDLLLAIVMVESEGVGDDIFGVEKLLDLQEGTVSVEESISYGVEGVCDYMDLVEVESITDLDDIRLVLQAYNFGTGFLDWCGMEWSQDAVLDYQKHMATTTYVGFVKGKAKMREGAERSKYGPYDYRDAYYTTHVFKYYAPASPNYEEWLADQEANGSDTDMSFSQLDGSVNVDYRMDALFPSGIPTSEAEMYDYLETISVPVHSVDGVSLFKNITVHKGLVNAYRQAFDGMYELGFPLDNSVYAYAWRDMASGTGSRSYHSYGVCIDLNTLSNPASYTIGCYAPGVDPLSITPEVVEVWEKAGFYWGGYWTGGYTDNMHFSYVNH